MYSIPRSCIPMRVVQNLVAECPLWIKSIPQPPITHQISTQTILHHKRSIGIDHVAVTPHEEDGYISLLLVVEHDSKYPAAYPVRDFSATTVPLSSSSISAPLVPLVRFSPTLVPSSRFMSTVVSNLNASLGIPHRVSLVGRHESNDTVYVNALLLGHLRRFVHDEPLVHKWAPDTALPLINHALSTAPNAELSSLS